MSDVRRDGTLVRVTIRVVLADDNLIVREGVRALIGTAPDIEVVGVAGDYDGLVAGAMLTVEVSPAAPHTSVAPLLLGSPL